MFANVAANTGIKYERVNAFVNTFSTSLPGGRVLRSFATRSPVSRDLSFLRNGIFLTKSFRPGRGILFYRFSRSDQVFGADFFVFETTRHRPFSRRAFGNSRTLLVHRHRVTVWICRRAWICLRYALESDQKRSRTSERRRSILRVQLNIFVFL